VFAQFYAFAGGTSGYYNPSDVAQGVWEWDGMLLTAAGWQHLTQSYSDQMQTVLAAILGVDPSRLASLGLRGGNANFQIDAALLQSFTSADPTCQNGIFGTRCSDFNLHFGITDGVNWVHMDSADPYTGPLGVLEHLGKDALGGNTIWQAGVPH
jgi:hypothetical protein